MSTFNPQTDTAQCLKAVNSVSIQNSRYLFNSAGYYSHDFIAMGVGTYTFTGVTTIHPIGFDINDDSKFEVISGTKYGNPVSTNQFGSSTSLNSPVQHYYGNIVVRVKGDFGQISYHCYKHGYMGGENRLVYYDECPSFNFNVKQTVSNKFLLNGSDRNSNSITNQLNYTIYLHIGDTVHFDLNFSNNHNFNILESDGATSVNNAEVTNQGGVGGESVSWTPSSIGTYYYACSNHSSMRGEIVVQNIPPTGTQAPTPTSTYIAPYLVTEYINITESSFEVDDLKKYLNECGETHESIVITNYEIIGHTNLYTNIKVNYICSLSNESKLCVHSWMVYCSENLNNIYFNPECVELDANIDSIWKYNSNLDAIIYSKIIGACSNNCLFTDYYNPPQNPTYGSCPNITPTITTTITSTEAVVPTRTETPSATITKLNLSTHSLRLLGDKPSPDLSVFSGNSFVINKPNSSDFDQRCFYWENLDGYFYDQNEEILSKNSLSPFSKSIFGKEIFFTSSSDKYSFVRIDPLTLFLSDASLYEATPTPSDVFDFDLARSNVCILTEKTPTITHAQTPTTHFVEDQSVFKAVYPNYIVQGKIPTKKITQLNFDYWLFNLPANIYNTNNWFNIVGSEGVPSFKIIQDSTDFTKPIFSFSPSHLVEEVNSLDCLGFMPTTETTTISITSTETLTNTPTVPPSPNLYLLSIPLDFASRFLKSFSFDPVYQVNNPVYSQEYKVTIQYSFVPDANYIDNILYNPTDYSFNNQNNQIVKTERLEGFINAERKNVNLNTFDKLYGVDKTSKKINYNNEIISGSVVIMENPITPF